MSLTTFYNPNPQDKWENIMEEAAVFVREMNGAAYLAAVYVLMVIQNLNFLRKHTIVLISQIGGKLCALSVGT
jgi:hypothetical protein